MIISRVLFQNKHIQHVHLFDEWQIITERLSLQAILVRIRIPFVHPRIHLRISYPSISGSVTFHQSLYRSRTRTRFPRYIINRLMIAMPRIFRIQWHTYDTCLISFIIDICNKFSTHFHNSIDKHRKKNDWYDSKDGQKGTDSTDSILMPSLTKDIYIVTQAFSIMPSFLRYSNYFYCMHHESNENKHLPN